MFLEFPLKVINFNVNILLPVDAMNFQYLIYLQTILFLKSSVGCFSRHKTRDSQDTKQSILQFRFLPRDLSWAL